MGLSDTKNSYLTLSGQPWFGQRVDTEKHIMQLSWVTENPGLMELCCVLVTMSPVGLKNFRMNNVITIFTLDHNLSHVEQRNRKFMGRERECSSHHFKTAAHELFIAHNNC
ncbi:hypothetical protein AMECASPLE_024046 [Ameca splendens]|uniref:Uncharacterized protein n=1 Tax=Ameca splendens TaxID=208324 RepID=A0ABV0XHF1_9TELE